MVAQMTMALVQVGVTLAGFALTAYIAVWKIDRQQRDERQAIRMAIVQELILSCEMLQNDEVKTGEPVRSTPCNAVYQALLAKLGSLKESEISHLVRTHDALTIFAAKIHNLGTKNANMDGYVHFRKEEDLARYKKLRAECLPCVCQCIKAIY